MKLLFSIITVFMLALPNVNASGVHSELLGGPVIKVEFLGEIGIPRRDCRGIGLGCLRGLVISLEIDFNSGMVTNPNTVIFKKENDRFMTLFFSSSDKNAGLDFEIDTDFKLDPKVASAFQRSSITLIKGVYKATRAKNGQYSVSVPISLN